MARDPRVVAELGRPETPDEAAVRKAASSRAYRSSQTTRNLVAALIATLAVVLIIILAVPRGTPPEREPIDVAGVAARVSANENRPLVVPDLPEDWRVNAATVEGDSVRAWTIVYVPGEERGFVRIAQGFDADPGWPSRTIRGAEIADTVTLGGVTWDRYEIRNPSAAGNVAAALGTTSGTDTILIYGTTDDAALEEAATAVAADLPLPSDEEGS
jgi:hypothetical protein